MTGLASARRRNRLLVLVAVVAATVGSAVSATAAAAPTPPPLTQFLADYFTAMDTALMPGGAAARLVPFYPQAEAVTPESAALLRYEVGKVDAFHRWVSDKRDAYKSISTAYTVDAISAPVPGRPTTVEVTTTTTMLWSPPHVDLATVFTPEKAAMMAGAAAREGQVYGPDDTVTSVVATQHVMRLVVQRGAWRIQSDRYLDPFVLSRAADHATPATAAATSPTTDASVLPAAGVETYDRSAAIRYADTWAMSYNPLYVNYSRQGGDCANFVSQALGDSKAAALAFESSWYYTYPSGGHGKRNRAGGSVDWINANHLQQFVTANPAGATYNFGSLGACGSWSATNNFDRTSMQPGDLHFYDWNADGVMDHSAIAVAELSDGTTLVDAHSTAQYHVRYDFGTSYDTTRRYCMDRMNDTINVP